VGGLVIPKMRMRGRASGQGHFFINGTSRYQLLHFSCHSAPAGSLPAFTWGKVQSDLIAEPLSHPLQTGLRFLRHPLPANPLASLAARCLYYQRGLPVYHVSYQHRFRWVRFRLFAGGAPSATGDFIAPVPDPLPFGSSLRFL